MTFSAARAPRAAASAAARRAASSRSSSSEIGEGGGHPSMMIGRRRRCATRRRPARRRARRGRPVKSATWPSVAGAAMRCGLPTCGDVQRADDLPPVIPTELAPAGLRHREAHARSASGAGHGPRCRSRTGGEGRDVADDARRTAGPISRGRPLARVSPSERMKPSSVRRRRRMIAPDVGPGRDARDRAPRRVGDRLGSQRRAIRTARACASDRWPRRRRRARRRARRASVAGRAEADVRSAADRRQADAVVAAPSSTRSRAARRPCGRERTATPAETPRTPGRPSSSSVTCRR